MAEMTAEQLDALRSMCETFAGQRGATLHERLGFGGSAAVFRMRIKDGSDVALKVYLPSFLTGVGGAAERRRIELQKSLLSHSCPSLVQFRGFDFEQGTCFIQMEYFPWPDLSKCIADVPRASIPTLIAQLVACVRFLDARGLVHRDIKPANILVSPGFDRLVLIDLGVVREMSDVEDRSDGTDHGQLRPFIATAQYSSPEYLFRTTPPSLDLWRALTIYQVGGVLHDLIARRPLFDDEVKTGNRYAVALAVQQKLPSLDYIKDVPTWMKTVTLQCLTKDPAKRLRLTNWDDFTPPSDDTSGLKKRLASLTAGTPHLFAAQQEALRVSLAQRDYEKRLWERLSTSLKECFGEGIQVEQFQLGPTRQCVFRLHLASLTWVVDVSTEVRWPDDGSNLQGDIYTSGVLVRKSMPSEFRSGTLKVAITPDSENIATVASSLVEDTTKILARAIEILEAGEPSNAVLLGKV